MHTILTIAIAGILAIGNPQYEEREEQALDTQPYSYEVALEEVPSIFTEPKCFGTFKVPSKPGPINTATICETQPELCPPTSAPPPSCMCRPPRPGALLGGYHVGDLGVSFDVVHQFAGKQNWGNLDGSNAGGKIEWAAEMQRSNPCVTVVISYAGVPDVGNLESCAAGEYQNYHLAYARRMKAAGLHGIILRIGWEWNIHTTAMSVSKDITKAPAFVKCFRNVVKALREGCPDCGTLFDWNSGSGVTEELFRAGYPGGDVVDIISVEAYDNMGPADQTVRWEMLQKKLNMVRDFAIANGKYTAHPEWGVWNCAIGGCSANSNKYGADNPYFVQKMCERGKDPANKVYYSIYFNGSDRFPTHNLFSPANARSKAAFQQYCGCN